MSGFGPTCSVLARPDKEKQRDSRTILYNHGTVLNRSGTVLHRSGQQFLQRFPTPAAVNWQAVGKELRLSFGGIYSCTIQPQKPTAKSPQSRVMSQSHESFGTSPSLSTRSKACNKTITYRRMLTMPALIYSLGSAGPWSCQDSPHPTPFTSNLNIALFAP